MDKKVIYYSRNNDNYITITANDNATVYTHYKNDRPVKTTFNKYAFIEYLKGTTVPNKYRKEVESYGVL